MTAVTRSLGFTRSLVALWVVISAVTIAPVSAKPPPLWDPELVALAKEFAEKGENMPGAQRALLLQRNREINQLALAGHIDDKVFQACQQDFVEVSVGCGEQAANKAGVKGFQVQGVKRDAAGKIIEHPRYMPGTDSDYITKATKLDQVKGMRTEYNAAFEERLTSMGGKPPEGVDWTRSNDVDLMADARATSKSEFTLIAEENNAAYKRPGAARNEAYLRDIKENGYRPPDLSDTSDYIDEMQDMVDHRQSMIAKDQGELAEILKKNPECKSEKDLAKFLVENPEAAQESTAAFKRASKLEAEIYKNRAIQGKYIERIGKANESLRKMLPPDSSAVLASSGLGAKANLRDMVNNPQNPLLLNSLKEEVLAGQLREHAELLAAVAKNNPARAEECKAAIAKMAAGLPAQQKAEVISAVRAQLGNEAAKDLATNLRVSKVTGGLDEALASVRASGSDLGHAAAKADAARVRSAVAEMQDGIARGRAWANAAGTPQSILQLDSTLASMTDEELESALRNNPALREQIDNAVKAARMDAYLLHAYSQTHDARRRVALMGLLQEAAEEPGVWGTLKGYLGKANETVPFDKLLGGMFAYWDALDVAKKSSEGDAEGAARKAFEAVLSAGATLPVSLMTSLTNAMLDAAKEGGFGLAVGSQDAEDLLAGIISVKGWENAEGFQTSPETNIDKLALNCTTEEQIRNIVANLAAAAASNSNDTPAIRRGKEAALNEKCVASVIKLWRARRTKMVMDYIALLDKFQSQFEQFVPEVVFEPSPAQLPGTGAPVPVTIQARPNPESLAAINKSLEEMERSIRALGGREQLADLRIKQTVVWTFGGKPAQETAAVPLDRLQKVLSSTKAEVASPGDYAATVKVIWDIQVLNGIKGTGDYRSKTWKFNLSWNPFKWIKTYEKLDPGDPLNTYQKDMGRVMTAGGEGFLQVRPPEETEKTPTPTPSASPTPSVKASVTPSATPAPVETSPPTVVPADSANTAGILERLANLFKQPAPPPEKVPANVPPVVPQNKKPVQITPTPAPTIPQPPKKPVTVKPTPTPAPTPEAKDSSARGSIRAPASSIYGTTTLISADMPWILESEQVIEETPNVDSAAVQNAGQSKQTINLASGENRGANNSRGKSTRNLSGSGTGYSASPLNESLGNEPQAPAPTKRVVKKSTHSYHFYSSPEMLFKPAVSTMPETSVTFTRLGPVTVWAQCLDDSGRVVGETKRATIDVKPPQFAMSFSPAQGAAPGQTVEATITTSPAVPGEFLDFRWIDPAANREERNKNASKIAFRMNASSVPLHVIARVPNYGDPLGEIQKTYSGSAWTIEIVSRRRGTAPADNPGTFVTDELFGLEAQISGGTPAETPRWKWTVNGGTTISSETSQTPTVSRHEPGNVSAKVEARDASGNLLAEGSITLQVIDGEKRTEPLAIKISLDSPSVVIGKQAAARAEVIGGKPPYTIEWKPAGSGPRMEVTASKEGILFIAATVRDARGKEASASANVKVEPAPLKVSVSAGRANALCGEAISLSASCEGGTLPYKFRWESPASGSADKASVTGLKPGALSVSVEVTDFKDRKAEGTASVTFSPVSLNVTGLKAKEKLGATGTAVAGENLPQNIKVKFEVRPGSAQSSGRSAQIVFNKPGTWEITAIASATVEGKEVEVGRSTPARVEVEPEDLSLVLEPADIVVGATASAKLVGAQGKQPDGVTAQWNFPQGAGGKQSGISASLSPDAPGSYAITASWNYAGGATKPSTATLNVKPLALQVSVEPAGAEDVICRVATDTKLPQGASIRWTASGTKIQGQTTGTQVHVLLPAVETKATISAVASNQKGAEIGQGSTDITGPKKADIAARQAQEHLQKGFQEEQAGHLEQAIAEYEKAIALVPDQRASSHIDDLRKKLAEEQNNAKIAQEHLQKGFQEEQAGRLEQAIAEYEQAVALVPDQRASSHIDELRKKLSDAQAPATRTDASSQTDTARAQELLNEAFRKESEGNLQGAVDAYMGALAIQPDDRVWNRVEALEDRLRVARSEAAKARATRDEAPAQASRRNESPQPHRQTSAENPLLAQKMAELQRLGNEALAIGNSMRGGNVNLATAQNKMRRMQQIQARIMQLKGEIERIQSNQ